MWNSTGVLVEGNWVWLSGYAKDGVTRCGNGMGFKLGGAGPNDGGHTVRNNLSWKNAVDGFHDNSGDLPMTLYNNTAWSNVRNSYTFFNAANTFRTTRLLENWPCTRIPTIQLLDAASNSFQR